MRYTKLENFIASESTAIPEQNQTDERGEMTRIQVANVTFYTEWKNGRTTGQREQGEMEAEEYRKYGEDSRA